MRENSTWLLFTTTTTATNELGHEWDRRTALRPRASGAIVAHYTFKSLVSSPTVDLVVMRPARIFEKKTLPFLLLYCCSSPLLPSLPTAFGEWKVLTWMVKNWAGICACRDNDNDGQYGGMGKLLSYSIICKLGTIRELVPSYQIRILRDQCRFIQ